MRLQNQYARMRSTARVRERALFASPRIPTELELQARWFAGEFGREFVSSSGDKIDIIQFGTWNRESGPDFRDAVVSISSGKPIRGCIEIDMTDRNWELHGHATNPSFDETVLHVFVEKGPREFFTRTTSNRNVPQVQINLSGLPDAFSGSVPLAHAGRCHAPLRNLPESQIKSVLDAAAQFRLQRKATRLRAKIDNHGIDEALFQEIAAALGYKENKLPFTLLAQRLTLKFLREKSDDAEALLFGIAGFLESPDIATYKKPTKEYVRLLWDRWWPYRDEMLRFIVPAKIWKTGGSRPSNHPQRRLAGLAVLVKKWNSFRNSLGKGGSKILNEFLGRLEHPFWTNHYTLTSKSSPASIAIIGDSRIAELAANVFFPFWVAQGVDVWGKYSELPARLTNRRVETGATRLFGDDPRRKEFLKTVAHQQALLQIYEDFCLQDDSDCSQCPFPEQMAKWS